MERGQWGVRRGRTEESRSEEKNVVQGGGAGSVLFQSVILGSVLIL